MSARGSIYVFAILASFVAVLSFAGPVKTTSPVELHHWNLDPFTYTRGYRLGFIARSTVVGYVIKTLEGALQLGFNSSESEAEDQSCIQHEEEKVQQIQDPQERIASYSSVRETCHTTSNPWLFSSPDTSLQDTLQKLKNTPVLLYYTGHQVVLWTRTYDIVEKAWPVDGTAPLPPKSFDGLSRFPISRYLHYGKGSIEGHFVRASIEGNLRETYESTIQVGPSGNNFVEMSIASTELFDYIVQCMATGRSLRIYYLRLYSVEEWPIDLIKNYRTDFRIYRVDLLDT